MRLDGLTAHNFAPKVKTISGKTIQTRVQNLAGASNPPLWMGDQPPHLTRQSTLHIVWAEHGGMILLFGPVCMVRIP